MFEKIARLFEDTVDDLGYLLKRSATFVVGKQSGQVVGALAGIAIGSLTGMFGFTELGKAASFITGEVLAIAAVAGVSGMIVQGDFEHQRENLLSRYKDEVGALLHKAPDKVQEEDLALVARGDFKAGIPANPSIRRELKNTWLNRNVNFVLATIVSAATYGAVHGLMAVGYDLGQAGAVFSELGGAHNALEAIGYIASSTGPALEQSLSLVKSLALNGLMGLGIYQGLKVPAHWAASEILGIDDHTVNDRITEIKRTLGHGHEISPEQVLGLFIHAHHDISEQIEAEYGKPFDQMKREQQHELLKVVEDYMDVKQVTSDINHGRMRPEELIFSAYGQKSGLEPAEEGSYVHQGNVLDGMWRGLQAVTGGYKTTANSRAHMAQVSDDIAAEMPGVTKVSVQTPDMDHASMHLTNEYEQPGRKQSFVARVGRSLDRSADGRSHVERLEQSSNQEVVITPS